MRYLFILIPFLCGYCSLLNAQNQTLNSGEQSTPINFYTGPGCNYTWVNSNPSIGLAATGNGTLIPPFTAVNNGTTPVTATITATPISQVYAYTANSGDATVSVIDVAQGKTIKTIPVKAGPWDVKASPNGKYIFLSNQAYGGVSIIETATNTVRAEIKGEWDPSGLAPTLNNEGVYSAEPSSSTVSLFKTDLSKITIPVEDDPFHLVMHPNGQYLYVANANSKSISVISTITNTIINTFRLSNYIYDIVISPDGNKLYVTDFNTNKVLVINSSTGVVTNIISTGNYTTRIAINNDGSRVYASNLISEDISVINTTTNAVIATINVDKLPNGLAVSPDGNTLYVTHITSNHISVIDTKTNTVTQRITVGQYPYSVTFTSSGNCGTEPIVYKVTVNPAPPPSISATSNIGALTTTYGTASATGTFQVSGASLTTGIRINPPTGFEISIDNQTFHTTLTIGNKGNVPPTPVYIRLAAATHTGSYSGDVIITTSGASDINLGLPNSSVEPAPLTVKANDISRLYGSEKPALSVSYNGFVNGENSSNLSMEPLLFTDATVLSEPGEYDIMISGAASPDYLITHINGTLTIKPSSQPLVIPNTFTPNGDGINDTWTIKNLDTYTNSNVQIFNRYGQKIYTYNGVNLAWTGQYQGSYLPAGTYYYIIKVAEKAEKLTGYVTLMR